MVQYARRAELSVRIDGHDAAGIVAPYLKEFSFTDNAHGKADELQIVLHDRDGKWAGAWCPKKGMMVQASIVCKSWETADKLDIRGHRHGSVLDRTSCNLRASCHNHRQMRKSV